MRVAQVLAASAALAALTSAFLGLRDGVPGLDGARRFWNELAPAVRDDPVADLYGFGEPVWVALERAIGEEDRYAIAAEGDGQHEIRNYAAYRLLPAIQVGDPADADVVVYWEVTAPRGCARISENVCLVRRGA